MNPFIWPTLILGALCFWLGMQAHQRLSGKRALLWAVSIVAAVPGVLFAAYYIKVLGEPLWLYRFRAIAGDRGAQERRIPADWQA